MHAVEALREEPALQGLAGRPERRSRRNGGLNGLTLLIPGGCPPDSSEGLENLPEPQTLAAVTGGARAP